MSKNNHSVTPNFKSFFFKSKNNTKAQIKIIKQKKLNDWEYVFEQLNDEIKVIHKKKFN